MASWRPQTDFEQEIVSMQPNFNFIYGDLTDTQKKLQNGYHPRPPAHLEYMERKSKRKTNSEAENGEIPSNDLNAIRDVWKMVNMQSLGEPAAFEDLDNFENRDLETIAMIRHCGMGPSEDTLLNEKTTIPTLPIPKSLHIVKRGNRKLPIVRDDKFFEMNSTRKRNAELLKEINSLGNEVNGLQRDKEKSSFENLTVLNEVKVKKPTETEIAQKGYQQYVDAYPTLETAKNIKNKSSGSRKANAKPKKNSFTCNNNEVLHSFGSYTSPNSSLESQSIYNSFDSFDGNNSSIYFSANESQAWNYQNTSNSESYSRVGQSNERPDRLATEQGRYYTPKQVYDRKRHF